MRKSSCSSSVWQHWHFLGKNVDGCCKYVRDTTVNIFTIKQNHKKELAEFFLTSISRFKFFPIT